MLKLKKKTKTLPVVCPWDPAIDTKNSDVKKYLESLDMNELKFVAGIDPCIIHTTSMPRWIATKIAATSATSIVAYNTSVFRHGVEKMENVADHVLTLDAYIDGGSGAWIPEDITQGPNESLIPTFSEYVAIEFFNTKTRNFIASVVAARSNLMKGTKKPYAAALSSFLPLQENKA